MMMMEADSLSGVLTCPNDLRLPAAPDNTRVAGKDPGYRSDSGRGVGTNPMMTNPRREFEYYDQHRDFYDDDRRGIL